MSGSKQNILLTGASGYIGGSVLHRLLEHRLRDNFIIIAFIRSPEKAKKLESFGIRTIVGSHDDLGLLKDAAADADVVFSCAEAGHVGAAQAILDGLKARYQTTGKISSLIRTSGSACFLDGAMGKHSDGPIYSDLNPEAIDALPPTALHRNVDSILLAADDEGYVKVYVVLPAFVYGVAKSPLVDAGIQNPITVIWPLFLAAAIDRKQVGMVGEGKNISVSVHIDDLAQFYITLFNAILAGDAIGHGHNGYYILENCRITAAELAGAIGRALFDLGLTSTDIPSSYTEDELVKYFGPIGSALGGNVLVRSERSRSIGWVPSKTTRDLLDSIKEDVEAAVKLHGVLKSA